MSGQLQSIVETLFFCIVGYMSAAGGAIDEKGLAGRVVLNHVFFYPAFVIGKVKLCRRRLVWS